MENQAMLALGVFLVTYALIISEKIHRTVIAMLGGLAMVLLGIVDYETAVHHIDFNTLGLLVGMMIMVAITGQTGIFRYIAIYAAKRVKCRPVPILIVLAVITALFSALLDNVTTVLLMVPVTLTLTQRLNIKPEPYLITLIISSNIGGTATLIGDPPNIMIGSAVKELTFLAFIHNLAPVALAILFVTIILLILFYRKQLVTDERHRLALLQLNEKEELVDSALLVKCLSVLGVTLAGFLGHQALHLESSTVALSGAFVLLLLTAKTEHAVEVALEKIEWPTIFFFLGLFVLVSGLVETGIIGGVARYAIEVTGGSPALSAMLILWLSAIASAFVDNIPFVATMIPLIQNMGQLGIANMEPLWWSLALGACLGGNGSLIGASANLIVAGLAAQQGYPLSFRRFLAIGFPLMLLSIVIANGYIYLRYLSHL